VYLADLYVAPQARRCGLGRRLVAAVAADARARDREFVWWVAQARNGDAQRLYRRFATVEVPLVGFAITLDGFQAMAADGAADFQAADDGPK
jgi:ribosomal protein S18 acetylase RimI-like enzyme